MHLSPANYVIDLLLRTSMFDCKPCSTPLFASSNLSQHGGIPFDHPTRYRNVVFTVQYLCHTRLDISFAVNNLSRYLLNPLQSH